jgi:Na+-driven multidrug efflux pump
VIINAGRIMLFLSDNDIVIKNGLIYLYISFMFEPFLAWGVILGGGLSGAGHTKDILAGIIVGIWLIRIPLCYIFGIILGFNAIGVWWAMNISIVAQCIFMSWRYFTRMRQPVLPS